MSEPELNLTPTRPYLARAIYEWICDNNLTPHLLVDATQPNTMVPEQSQITEELAQASIVNDAQHVPPGDARRLALLRLVVRHKYRRAYRREFSPVGASAFDGFATVSELGDCPMLVKQFGGSVH